MLEITLEVRELDRAFTYAVGVSNEDIDPDPETVIPQSATVRPWKKGSVEYEKSTPEFLLNAETHCLNLTGLGNLEYEDAHQGAMDHRSSV